MQQRFDPIDAIDEHSAGFADAAEANLGAEVESCPGWTVADLVAHLTDVHWFWATIAEERLAEPPEEGRPPRAPRQELVSVFRSGADRLVEVLRSADPSDAVWTWAPAQQDIAFISRHQVQEAAVHHFDAARAAGETLEIAPAVAVDSITEFLTFSVSSEADPAEPQRASLGGRLSLVCTDAPAGWTIVDGPLPGTVAFRDEPDEGAPTITGTASELLLFLYDRVVLDTTGVPAELTRRFRALCFTA